MRKLLLIVLAVIGMGALLRGVAGFGSDRHVAVAGLGLPTLGFGQIGSILTTVTALLKPDPSAADLADTISGNGQQTSNSQIVTAGPNVIRPQAPAGANMQPPPQSLASAPANQQPGGPDLRNIPPELLRFLNPALITTLPSGKQEMTPAAREALRQLVNQARTNPAAVRDQLLSVGKSLRGP